MEIYSLCIKGNFHFNSSVVTVTTVITLKAITKFQTKRTLQSCHRTVCMHFKNVVKIFAFPNPVFGVLVVKHI